MIEATPEPASEAEKARSTFELFQPLPLAAGVATTLVRHNRPENDSPADFYAGWGRLFDARPAPADRSPADSLLRVLPEVLGALPERALVWVEIGSQPLADAHVMTKNVLAELDRRLATGPLRHDAPVPFFHFYGGKMMKDILGA